MSIMAGYSSASVFAQVLDHKSFGLAFHVGSYERGQVQVRTPIEVELVLEHGMHGICGSTLARDGEFRQLNLCIVATAVWGQVGDGTARFCAMGRMRVVVELGNELIRVDVSCESCHD
jgi:hypothetical protein